MDPILDLRRACSKSNLNHWFLIYPDGNDYLRGGTGVDELKGFKILNRSVFRMLPQRKIPGNPKDLRTGDTMGVHF